MEVPIELLADGVHVVDGASFKQIGFIPTGTGAHGHAIAKGARLERVMAGVARRLSPDASSPAARSPGKAGSPSRLGYGPRANI